MALELFMLVAPQILGCGASELYHDNASMPVPLLLAFPKWLYHLSAKITNSEAPRQTCAFVVSRNRAQKTHFRNSIDIRTWQVQKQDSIIYGTATKLWSWWKENVPSNRWQQDWDPPLLKTSSWAGSSVHPFLTMASNLLLISHDTTGYSLMWSLPVLWHHVKHHSGSIETYLRWISCKGIERSFWGFSSWPLDSTISVSVVRRVSKRMWWHKSFTSAARMQGRAGTRCGQPLQAHPHNFFPQLTPKFQNFHHSQYKFWNYGSKKISWSPTSLKLLVRQRQAFNTCGLGCTDNLKHNYSVWLLAQSSLKLEMFIFQNYMPIPRLYSSHFCDRCAWLLSGFQHIGF